MLILVYLILGQDAATDFRSDRFTQKIETQIFILFQSQLNQLPDLFRIDNWLVHDRMALVHSVYQQPVNQDIQHLEFIRKVLLKRHLAHIGGLANFIDG